MSAYGLYLGREAFVRGPVDPPSSSNRCCGPAPCQSRQSAPVPRLKMRHSMRVRNSMLRVSPADSLVAVALSKRKLANTFGNDLPFARGILRTMEQDEAEGNDADEENEAASVAASTPSGAPLKINLDLQLYRSRQARIAAFQTLDADKRRTLLKSSEDGLRRCLALDASDARAYVVLGRLLVAQKRYDEARQLYADGCANTGNANPYIWTSWGHLEAVTGNVARARKLFDAAVVVDETHACAWQNWGLLEKAQGNYLRARDLWMSGIQRCRRTPQKSNPYLYNSLACLAAELGKTEEARAWFEEGTRSQEGASSVALWQAWAVMEATQGDATAVRFLFKKALQANPRSRYAHLAWALWERKQGNAKQCVALLRRGQALNPTDPALYQAWALVEREQGNLDAARDLFRAGLKADPYHLHLYQAWGVMELQAGDPDAARRLFQEGVWADPGSRDVVFIFHAWATLEWRCGNAPLARELFKSALKVEPRSENTWATWIAMEEELGLFDKANELRIRRAEKQWEFVIPSNFTTRRDGGPLAGLGATLSKFFSAREGATAGGAGGNGGASVSRSAGGKSLRDLLPEDFVANLKIEDVLEPGALASVPATAMDGAPVADMLPAGAAPARQSHSDQREAPVPTSASAAAASGDASASPRAAPSPARGEQAGGRPRSAKAATKRPQSELVKVDSGGRSLRLQARPERGGSPQGYGSDDEPPQQA